MEKMKKMSAKCSLCKSSIIDLSHCHTIIDDSVDRIMSGKESPTIYLLCPACYQVFCVEFRNMKLKMEVQNG